MKKGAEEEPYLLCPHCGKVVSKYKNPKLTVDIAIRLLDHPQKDNIVLIERKNPPHGWALPGGFVDYGETVEAAAVREAREETSLDVTITGLIGIYSDPERDPRSHTVTIAFAATASGSPRAKDDALNVKIFTSRSLPSNITFDHNKIISDYFSLFLNSC